MKCLRFIIISNLIVLTFFSTSIGPSQIFGKSTPPSSSSRTKTNVNKTIKKYEALYKKKLKLPKKVPIEITKSSGTIIKDQSMLELEYFNENTKEIYKIFVRPIDQTLVKRHGDKIYSLKDGTKVIYRTHFRAAYQIEFQKDGWNYYIGIGRNTNKKITPQHLISIADSIN